MSDVIQFPKARRVRSAPKVRKPRAKPTPPLLSPPTENSEREQRIDKIAEMLSERAKKSIREWQAAEGLPDEATMLVDRLTALAKRPDGLPAVEVARLYECLPPRDDVTQGLDSESLRLLERTAELARDENGPFRRALDRRLRRQENGHV